MNGKLVTVFGGSGFLGRNVVRKLAERGARVVVACRSPEKAKHLKSMGEIGQITPVKCNVIEAENVANTVKGSDYVVNLTGILFQSGRNRFDSVQAWGPANIAKAAADNGVEGLVHVSAIGADANSKSDYARSKAAGEAAVGDTFPRATILRPSVIFGKDDNFFNLFGSLSRFTPVLPLIGGGKTKFQPVYVDDVAEAVVRSLENTDCAGKTYELGGPRVLDFKELMQMTLQGTQRSARLIPVPFWWAKIEAMFLEIMPNPLLTRDQVELLKSDNVAGSGTDGLAELGIEAKSLEAVLPTYLDKYRPKGSYHLSRI